MEDLTKEPTVNLVKELTNLERNIDFMIYKYNLISKELCRRFPMLENEEEFKPKVLTKDKIDV